MPKTTYLENLNFDWELFGTIIRKTRKKLGFSKAEEFCASIYRRTRVELSPVTYYKIESGKQEPTAMQLFSICMALYGEPLPKKIIEACTSEEWKFIINHRQYNGKQLLEPVEYEIPSSWEQENIDLYGVTV